MSTKWIGWVFGRDTDDGFLRMLGADIISSESSLLDRLGDWPIVMKYRVVGTDNLINSLDRYFGRLVWGLKNTGE